MSAGRWITAAAVVVLVGALAWLFFVVLPDWYGAGEIDRVTAAVPGPAPSPTPRIRARLFFVGEDGTTLVGVEQEIPFGGSPLEQGRHLLAAQFAAPPPPWRSPVPPGAALRSFFVTERGRAYVDLTPETAATHPGGSLDERLTVAAIVEVLTTNLPAITEVQILVGGREVDSLAGHVDLRRVWTRDAFSSPVPAAAGLSGVTAPPSRN